MKIPYAKVADKIILVGKYASKQLVLEHEIIELLGVNYSDVDDDYIIDTVYGMASNDREGVIEHLKEFYPSKVYVHAKGVEYESTR